MAAEPIDDTLMADPEEEDPELIARTKIVNEEYKIWKKNAPFLYDLMLRYLALVNLLSTFNRLTWRSQPRLGLAYAYHTMVPRRAKV